MDRPTPTLEDMLISIPPQELVVADFHRIIGIHQTYAIRKELAEISGPVHETPELRRENERRECLRRLVRNAPSHVRPSLADYAIAQVRPLVQFLENLVARLLEEPTDASLPPAILHLESRLRDAVILARERAEKVVEEEVRRLANLSAATRQRVLEEIREIDERREAAEREAARRSREADVDTERLLAVAAERRMLFTEEFEAIRARQRERVISEIMRETPVDPLKEDEIQCPICQADFGQAIDGTSHEAARLPCKHVFGTECIAHWLHTCATCPLCRYKYDNRVNDQRVAEQADSDRLAEMMRDIEVMEEALEKELQTARNRRRHHH